MSKPYFPGQQARAYHRLPSKQREAVRIEVDRRFREKTNVTRQLDPTSRADLELRRIWLRIRDEVMEQKEYEEWLEFRHELDVDNLTLIPDEMRYEHWDQGAELLETWFGRAPATKPKYSSPVTDLIKMDWVLKFSRARSVFDQIIKDRIWINTKSQERMELFFSGIPLDGQAHAIGDLSKPATTVDQQWINSRPVSSTLSLDALTAALGGFELHVAIAGKATRRQASGFQELVITVEEVGIYVWDSFDFEGDQFLGMWGYRDTLVYNSDFREWRIKNNAGGDFLIFSDIKREKLAAPDVVAVKM